MLFFNTTLPFMMDLVLSTKVLSSGRERRPETRENRARVLPSFFLMLSNQDVCSEPIPFLEKQQDRVIMLSQKQIACLLANAFFCTFPGRKYFGPLLPNPSPSF